MIPSPRRHVRRTDGSGPRRGHVRRHFPVVAAVMVALGLSACTGSGDVLVIYSGRTQNLVAPLLEEFAEETGTSIQVNYGDTNDLALLLAEEGAATEADVFLSQSPGAVSFLDDRGLLGEVPPDTIELVDEGFVADDGHWIGVTGRQRVLVYNSEAVDAGDLPQHVDDLVEEPFRGRVAVAPPNASFQDFVSAMRLERGDAATRAWLEGLVANDVATYANNNAIVDAVGRGEVDMGLVNHYYNVRFLDEDPSVPSRNHRFADSDIGNLVLPSTASIVTGTDHPDAAAEFLRYLLSDPAQETFRDETFEYPLARGVPPPDGLPPLDAQGPDVDLAELGADLPGTLELIRDSGLEG